jgi:hypothetical protein
MPAGRKIEHEVEARRHLRAALRSGLTIGEWARARGIDGRSLRAWGLNIARRRSQARGIERAPRKRTTAAHALVELVPNAARAGVAVGQRYVIEVAGARFEFGDDVSDATLRRVLEALRSC